MRSITAIGLVSLTGLLISAPPATAPRVTAEVVLVQGPVAARVQVGDRPIRHYRPRRAVIVERREVVYAPRTIVVQRRHIPRGRAHGWWRNEGYRRVVIWVDVDGRYYDRDYVRHAHRDNDRDDDRDRDYDRDRDDRRGLRPVNMYERGGQYYDLED